MFRTTIQKVKKERYKGEKKFFMEVYLQFVFRKKLVYPTICIEKSKTGQGSAPLAKVLARISSLEASHKKEIAKLRAELEECQIKCKKLQEQLYVYQNMEK